MLYFKNEIKIHPKHIVSIVIFYKYLILKEYNNEKVVGTRFVMERSRYRSEVGEKQCSLFLQREMSN